MNYEEAKSMAEELTTIFPEKRPHAVEIQPGYYMVIGTHDGLNATPSFKVWDPSDDGPTWRWVPLSDNMNPTDILDRDRPELHP